MKSRIARACRSLLAVAVILAAPLLAAAQQPPVVALVGASVVDIDGGPEITDAVVLVETGRIKSVGPASAIAVPDGATVVPMNGKWLIPGLMNMHVHFGLKLPGAVGAALANETDTQQVLRMASNARLSLLAGVTTVRLTGEDHGNDFALLAAIERGEAIGPRIQTAGDIIVPTGGHGFLEADGPYALAHAARLQIKQGATWIKTAISGGIADLHGSIEAAPMTDDELSMLIEVAHRNGVKVTAHNGSNEAALQALRFGIDCFEHGYHLKEDVLRQMQAKGVWLVPTIVVSQEGVQEYFRKIGSPDWYLARVASTGRDHWAMLRNAIRLNVPIALGTDQFPFEPNGGTTATVREAELYVEAGMTSLQALQAATIQPAKMLGVDREVGRIKAGQYADIVAVDADPSKNISALRTLSFVMKGGTIVRNDADGPPAQAAAGTSADVLSQMFVWWNQAFKTPGSYTVEAFREHFTEDATLFLEGREVIHGVQDWAQHFQRIQAAGGDVEIVVPFKSVFQQGGKIYNYHVIRSRHDGKVSCSLAAGHAEIRAGRIASIVLVRSELDSDKAALDPACWRS